MLQTERLDLRQFEIADFDAVHAYASDPLVTRYTSFGPNTFEQTRDFLTRTIKSYGESPRRSFIFGMDVHGSLEQLVPMMVRVWLPGAKAELRRLSGN